MATLPPEGLLFSPFALDSLEAVSSKELVFPVVCRYHSLHIKSSVDGVVK